MIEAVSLSLDTDLRDFSTVLTRQGVAHRIVEEAGRQVIYVGSSDDAELVREKLAGWQPQQWHAQAMEQPLPRARKSSNILMLLLESPVTAVLIGLCVLVAVVSSLGAQTQRVDYLFYPLVDSGNFWSLLADLQGPTDWLRSLTPMFLHFGELHLIFNMLWLWYFGRQLESVQPAWVFALLIICTAFASNTTQYLVSHYNNFGGMSGVVYGLVGYTWIINTFMPATNLQIRNNMFVFFVVALVVMELFAGSWIATAAHVGGLLTGLVLGAAMVWIYRVLLKRKRMAR